MKSLMKGMHRGEKGFTLIELLIVVAILGIIAAVVIPNLGTFMTTGRLSAANTEAENVKSAELAFFAEYGEWPADTEDTTPGSYAIYLAGNLTAKYFFDGEGFISGVSDLGGLSAGTTAPLGWGTTIEWDPTEYQWVRA